MRFSKTIPAIVVLAGVMLPSHAAAPHADFMAQASPAKAAPLVLREAGAPAPIEASLTVGRADDRGRIAACAKLAAIRGVSARTSGADYATQNRVLELSFILCMSGTATRD